MIALPLSLSQSALAVLFTSLGILVLVIAYRKLLAYLGKGKKADVKYMKLYPIKSPSVQGRVVLFYEAEEKTDAEMVLLDKDWNLLQSIDKRISRIGGNKVDFDTTAVPNGTYFYKLITENQSDAKRIRIDN